LETICPGRFTARLDKPVVLFLIGMRMNNLRALPRWWWFFNSMPRMLKELDSRPDSGLLWHRTYLSLPYILVQQYWEGFDKLLAYASDPSGVHFPSWSRYMRELMKEGPVGIWHETYLVEPGKFECVYGNMPRFGLAAAGDHVKLEGRLAAARERLGV
jgi:hypothetical protein